VFLCCRWLKSDVTKKESQNAEENLATDASCQSVTTLDDCFAQFTQHEEVHVVVSAISV